MIQKVYVEVMLILFKGFYGFSIILIKFVVYFFFVCLQKSEEQILCFLMELERVKNDKKLGGFGRLDIKILFNGGSFSILVLVAFGLGYFSWWGVLCIKGC